MEPYSLDPSRRHRCHAPPQYSHPARAFFRESAQIPLSQKGRQLHYWVRSNGRAVHSENGDIEFVVTTRDVSAQKQIEDMLREARDHLETRVQQRTAELSRVNRELQKEIEQRKTAEAALRHSERQKSAILDAIQEHVVFQDAEQRIIWANRAAADSVKMPAGKLAGRRCYELWGDANRQCPVCPVAKALADGGAHETERTTRTAVPGLFTAIRSMTRTKS